MDYTAVLERRPRDMMALCRRGLLYKELEQYQAALQDLEQAWHFFNTAKELALVEDGKVLQPPTLLDMAAQATQSIRFQLKLKEMSHATRAIRRCSHRTVCA